MRSTDFCTPKLSNSSTPASPFPSAAAPFSRKSPFGLSRNGTALVPKPCGLVLVHAKRLLSRSRSARPWTLEAGTRQLGPPDANEAGEDCASHRNPHFDGQSSASQGRCLPLIATVVTISDTPVASSELIGAELAGASFRALAERPPRPVPRGPCERRALSRSEVSSIARWPRNPLAPKCERTQGTSADGAALT